MMAKTTIPGMSREKKLGRISLIMGVLGGMLAALGAIALSLGLRGDTDRLDFIKGLGIGIFTALPLFFAVLTYRAIRVMDEYARSLQLQAAAFAFMVTMILSGGLVALQSYWGFHLPAWTIYVAGMLTWAVAAGVQSYRAGRDE